MVFSSAARVGWGAAWWQLCDLMGWDGFIIARAHRSILGTASSAPSQFISDYCAINLFRGVDRWDLLGTLQIARQKTALEFACSASHFWNCCRLYSAAFEPKLEQPVEGARTHFNNATGLIVTKERWLESLPSDGVKGKVTVCNWQALSKSHLSHVENAPSAGAEPSCLLFPRISIRWREEQ